MPPSMAALNPILENIFWENNLRRQFVNKTVFFGLLAIVLVFGFIGCDDGNGNSNDEFTVTFDLDGGNIGGNTNSVPIKVKSGETIASLPNPQKGTDVFGGWFTQKNGAGTSFTSSTKVTANLTVYAKWTPANNPFAGEWLWAAMNVKIVIDNDLKIKLFLQDLEAARGFIVINGTNASLTYTEVWKGGTGPWSNDPQDIIDAAGVIGSSPIEGTITGSSVGSTLFDNFVKQ